MHVVCGYTMPLQVFQLEGAEIGSHQNVEVGTESGWYILGEDQQHIGPYAFSELRG